MNDSLRCKSCHGVIGVYEPLVAIIDGAAQPTSLARAPELAEGSAPSYHRHCYEALQASSQAS